MRTHPEVKLMRTLLSSQWQVVRERAGIIIDRWPLDEHSVSQLESMRDAYLAYIDACQREVRTRSRDDLARAYDPEAFQDNPTEQRAQVAAIPWKARRSMATEAADRVLSSHTTTGILDAVLSWASDDEGNMPHGLREVLAPWLPGPLLTAPQ